MKRILSTFLVLLSIHVHADLTIVQEIENLQDKSINAKEQITLYVSGQNIRLDKGQSLTSIMFNDKKVTVSIIHEARQYITLPHDQFKGLIKRAPFSDINQIKVETTSTTEKINGFNCRLIRIIENNAPSTELWVSKDAMDNDSFLGEFKSFMEFGMNNIFGLLDKYPDLKGVPIRVTEFVKNQPSMRSTVKQLNRGTLPSNIFEVPAGYDEIKIPSGLNIQDMLK